MSVDRSWFRDAEEEVRVDSRTRHALDEILERKATETKDRIKAEKAAVRRKLSEPVKIEKLWPISYWAEMFNFSEGAIREACKMGDIRAEKLRGQWRISESAIREFILNERKKNAG